MLTGDTICTSLTIEDLLDPVVQSSNLTSGVATIVIRSDAAPGSYGNAGQQALALTGILVVESIPSLRGANYFVTVSATPQASSTASPIPAWVQGYARTSADEACLTGWGASWEQWPNRGAGGWVCTRTIPSLG